MTTHKEIVKMVADRLEQGYVAYGSSNDWITVRRYVRNDAVKLLREYSDLAIVPAAPNVRLELPKGDNRKARVVFAETKGDTLHVCVAVDDDRLPEAWTNLLAYVLQDDMHNRLTPRVIDIAYTAFMQAKQPNSENGGASDWFNDTRPKIREMIEKLRKDLIEEFAVPPDTWIDDAGRIKWFEWRVRDLEQQRDSALSKAAQPVANVTQDEIVSNIFSTLRHILGIPQAVASPLEHCQAIIDEIASWSKLGATTAKINAAAKAREYWHNAAEGDNPDLEHTKGRLSEAVKLIQQMLAHIGANTCIHENTHRAGSIWEVCDACGAKWADDKGGKPEFQWPAVVKMAEAFLAVVTNQEPDVVDIVAGALQTSRGHAIELMQAAVASNSGEAQRAMEHKIPANFTTHRNSWRKALEIAKERATGDDVSYWEHELQAFDRSFDRLLAKKDAT